MKYKHKVRGTVYEIISEDARLQISLLDLDMTRVVVYRSVNNPSEVWVRPAQEFYDGRFEEVIGPLV